MPPAPCKISVDHPILFKVINTYTRDTRTRQGLRRRCGWRYSLGNPANSLNIYKGARHWTQISDPQRAMHSLLVASSSALALRACPPQLVASSSAARAARSPTTARRCALGSSARAARSPATARRKLLGARAARSPPRRLALRARSRCALAHHSSSQAHRRLALRARPSRLVASSSVGPSPPGAEAFVRLCKTHRLPAPSNVVRRFSSTTARRGQAPRLK